MFEVWEVLTVCREYWLGCDTSLLDRNRPRIAEPVVSYPCIAPSICANDNYTPPYWRSRERRPIATYPSRCWRATAPVYPSPRRRGSLCPRSVHQWTCSPGPEFVDVAASWRSRQRLRRPPREILMIIVISFGIMVCNNWIKSRENHHSRFLRQLLLENVLLVIDFIIVVISESIWIYLSFTLWLDIICLWLR